MGLNNRPLNWQSSALPRDHHSPTFTPYCQYFQKRRKNNWSLLPGTYAREVRSDPVHTMQILSKCYCVTSHTADEFYFKRTPLVIILGIHCSYWINGTCQRKRQLPFVLTPLSSVWMCQVQLWKVHLLEGWNHHTNYTSRWNTAPQFTKLVTGQ